MRNGGICTHMDADRCIRMHARCVWVQMHTFQTNVIYLSIYGNIYKERERDRYRKREGGNDVYIYIYIYIYICLTSHVNIYKYMFSRLSKSLKKWRSLKNRDRSLNRWASTSYELLWIVSYMLRLLCACVWFAITWIRVTTKTTRVIT